MLLFHLVVRNLLSAMSSSILIEQGGHLAKLILNVGLPMRQRPLHPKVIVEGPQHGKTLWLLMHFLFDDVPCMIMQVQYLITWLSTICRLAGLTILSFERLLHTVIDGIVPLLGVRKKTVHEVAGASSAIGLVRILEGWLQMIEAEADSAEVGSLTTHRVTLPHSSDGQVLAASK